LLTMIKIEPSALFLDELRSPLSDKQNQGADFTEEFRFFLTELFTILENLTAGIMIKPLHKELSQITAKPQSADDGEDA